MRPRPTSETFVKSIKKVARQVETQQQRKRARRHCGCAAIAYALTLATAAGSVVAYLLYVVFIPAHGDHITSTVMARDHHRTGVGDNKHSGDVHTETEIPHGLDIHEVNALLASAAAVNGVGECERPHDYLDLPNNLWKSAPPRRFELHGGLGLPFFMSFRTLDVGKEGGVGACCLACAQLPQCKALLFAARGAVAGGLFDSQNCFLFKVRFVSFTCLSFLGGVRQDLFRPFGCA